MKIQLPLLNWGECSWCYHLLYDIIHDADSHPSLQRLWGWEHNRMAYSELGRDRSQRLIFDQIHDGDRL